MTSARLSALVLSFCVAGCAGSPQRLPVALSICNAVARTGGFTVVATIQNKSDRPIANLGLALSFYRNFRYASYTAETRLKQELDPGRKRDVTFDVSAPKGAEENGQAIR